jgi:rhamnulokinase
MMSALVLEDKLSSRSGASTMGATSNYLALDLGAESGRGMLGRFDGERLSLEEVHRFPNEPVRLLDTLYWNLPSLFAEAKNALRVALSMNEGLESIGVDTWGVDFGLIGRGDTLLGNPVHYRDARTDGMMDIAFARMPCEEIYARTGLQFMPFNTLYQLLALVQSESPLLKVAQTFLMMPDLLAWLLTGQRVVERTNASTTQLYDPQGQSWSDEICKRVGIPREILPEIVEPGTDLGSLHTSVRTEIGSVSPRVITPATHDTASAVVAVPALPAQTKEVPDWCYLSSGTWSLLGIEMPHPVINSSTRDYNFANEGGVAGTTRLLKNIMGLWLVQECRRTWKAQGREFSYDDLLHRAEESPPFTSLVDPDHTSFLAPGDMPARLAAVCIETGQVTPRDEGAMVRCALESLALKYRWTIERLEAITGGLIKTIHVVGGGVRNTLLCQFTADACGRSVHAGPIEATAAGNVLIQAMARGRIGSVAELRAIVSRSFPVVIYEPRQTNAWSAAAERFNKLL